MALEDFVPSREYKKFEETNGEDTFIKMNLTYIAFQLDELYSEENNKDGQFDELCEDILEIYLDGTFDDYNLVDVIDGVAFIIKDSNYSISEYTRTYKNNRDKVFEELLAYLDKTRRTYVREKFGD